LQDAEEDKQRYINEGLQAIRYKSISQTESLLKVNLRYQLPLKRIELKANISVFTGISIKASFHQISSLIRYWYW